MSADSLDSLTRDSFAGRIGETFSISLEGTADLELKLAEASAVGGDSDAREPFSVVFVGPMEPLLPQAIYSLMHAQMGMLDLFLVPIGPDRERTGMQYEAVFT